MADKAAKASSGTKRRVVTSYENLTAELIDALKLRYPLGFTDYMTRVDKPNGEFFYGVMLETDEISYFVKISVKIDDKAPEEIEKDIFSDDDSDNDEIKGADDIADASESDDE